jgi:hypothetical protein
VVTLIDLHHAGVSRVNLSLKNRSVCERVSKRRLTSRYLDKYGDVFEVIADDILRRSKLYNLLRFYSLDLAVSRICDWNCSGNVRNCYNCCKNAGYNKPLVLTNKNGRSRFQRPL